jgi:hypothetical protein
MGRPRNPICPRCKKRRKVAGRGYCRKCHAEREAERRSSNPAPSRAAVRRWYKRNPEKVRTLMREWEAVNHARRLAYRRKRTPQMRARDAVKYALRVGKLTRPDRCERCKKPCKPQAHHADYSKKLEVEWLCKTCHGKEHRL